jgi:ribosomal protein S18 acetylase RimI-like enzyme
MLIEPPCPDDVPIIERIAAGTGIFIPDEIESVREMLQDSFTASDPDEFVWRVYRATRGAPPLGFVCYGPASFSDGTFELYWIAVAPTQQRQKVGRALLAHLEHDLQQKNARHLYVETSDKPEYAPSREFYLRCGFEQAAHLPDFYRVGDGKVVYRKTFK